MNTLLFSTLGRQTSSSQFYRIDGIGYYDTLIEATGLRFTATTGNMKADTAFAVYGLEY
jgi:hypothetical protein